MAVYFFWDYPFRCNECRYHRKDNFQLMYLKSIYENERRNENGIM